MLNKNAINELSQIKSNRISFKYLNIIINPFVGYPSGTVDSISLICDT